MTTYKGKCFCGAVEIETQGEPEAMGYCHCSSCRSWSAAPVNAFTLWKPQNVRVTKGAELVGKFAKTEMSHRQYCKRCGGVVEANYKKRRCLENHKVDEVRVVPAEEADAAREGLAPAG